MREMHIKIPSSHRMEFYSADYEEKKIIESNINKNIDNKSRV